MTPYERGYAAGLKAAAETCKTMAEVFATAERYSGLSGAADACGSAILSLPILGEATNPGEQELPAAAAKALPSESRGPSDRDATEGTSAQYPARPGPSQECVMVPRAMLEWLNGSAPHPTTGMWFERPDGAGPYWWRSEIRAMLAAAKEEHDAR